MRKHLFIIILAIQTAGVAFAQPSTRPSGVEETSSRLPELRTRKLSLQKRIAELENDKCFECKTGDFRKIDVKTANDNEKTRSLFAHALMLRTLKSLWTDLGGVEREIAEREHGVPNAELVSAVNAALEKFTKIDQVGMPSAVAAAEDNSFVLSDRCKYFKALSFDGQIQFIKVFQKSLQSGSIDSKH